MSIQEFKKAVATIPLTKVLAGAITLFLLSFLLSYALMGQGRSREVLKKMDHFDLSMNRIGVSVSTKSCENLSDCYNSVKNQSDLHVVHNEGDDLDLSGSKLPPEATEAYVLLRFDVSVDAAMIEKADDALVFSLPEAHYERADIYWQGKMQRHFFGGDRLFVAIGREELVAGTSSIEVLLEVSPSDLSNVMGWEDPFFAMQHGDYGRYLSQLSLIQLGQGEQIGMIARVVLAALMLLFFVILDGSETALGLSLAMGFEAAGMCFGNVSLRHQWIAGSTFWNITKLSFYTIGDFIGLYFMLCLAGRRRFNVWTWIAIGGVVGVGYGISMNFLRDTIPFVEYFWIPRNLATSGVGVVFCIIAVGKTIKARDLWRSVAIIFAIVGMGVAVVECFGSMFPGFDDNQTATTIMAIGKSIKAYMLTLSGLAAIASMRKELAQLEVERAKSRKMAHELQLGREMQEALLQIPALPEGVEVSASHIPAAYVSGDTYFFDWNPTNRVFTVLLNDVPGHGLQAALKAFACNVIAKTIWGQGKSSHDRRRSRSQFQNYQEQVVEMLRHQNDSMPFNAFTGIEFFFEQSKAVVYRSNYNDPVMISYENDVVKVTSLSCRSGDFLEVPLTPGLCFLLVSDGLIPNSKAQKRFVDQLKIVVKAEKSIENNILNTEAILGLLLDPNKIKMSDVDDDRTIIVVRWTGQKAVVAA